jgi:glutamate-1-semialdehyde 2,1-aminomutase
MGDRRGHVKEAGSNRRSSAEQQLIDRAKALLPGGVLANLSTPDQFMFVPERGEGGRLYDKSGYVWVDYRMASGALILGHRHPVVEKAVTEQINKSSAYTQLLNEPAIKLAEKVVDIIPSAGQVRFALSGGEATFYAMRLARAHTKRDKILKFEGAYHGHGDHIVGMLPDGYKQSRIGHPGAAGVPRSAVDDYIVVPFNDLERVRQAVHAQAKDIAGVIVEPLLGFIPPRAGFLEGLRDLTKKHDICLIFDEVVTGFWMGVGGAQSYFGITPDLTTLGKAFGGGFPISAVCGPCEIMAHFDHVNQPMDEVAYHGGSLYGHPVSATASLAMIGEMQKAGTWEHLETLGHDLRDALRNVTKRYNHIPAQVMGIGPTWHIAFTAHEINDYRSNMAEDAAHRRTFMHILWENRIHLLGRGYISLLHNKEDFERTVRAVDQAFRAM